MKQKKNLYFGLALFFLCFLISFPFLNFTKEKGFLHVDLQKNNQGHLIYFEPEDNHRPINQVHSSILASNDVLYASNEEIDDEIKVIPGGQSVGIDLQTKGVLVVGHHQITNSREQSTDVESGEIKVGDTILQMNGQKIENVQEVRKIINEYGKKEKSLMIKVKRGDNTFNTSISPVYDEKEKDYRIGLYIRDSASGIGTMTFFEPKSQKYGALGHVISDMDTKKMIEINNGTIMRSNVNSIEKGINGSPGEKNASFTVKDHKIGTVTKNSPFGIFGELDTSIKNNLYDQPMPIALSHEIKKGPAKILTVIKDEKVEEFDIEIIDNTPHKFPATKGLVVKVTDPELLDKTGGIVQGMSGSPIIQDDKIVGAITHVFINDPTSGYGVHIEWMLEEANIQLNKQNKLSFLAS